MKESDFQSKLIKKLDKLFPGSITLKNDPSHRQGIPDLLFLYKDRWAALECKVSNEAHKQPNQPYYIQKMNDMSYAAIITPDNEKEILNEMERSFKEEG